VLLIAGRDLGFIASHSANDMAGMVRSFTNGTRNPKRWKNRLNYAPGVLWTAAMVIRDRVKDLIAKGMSLADLKAARPTRDYDGRYGATSGAWTTEQFVEAVY